MSWFTPIALTHDERSVSVPVATKSFGAAARGGLGSASAGSQWMWSEAPAARPAPAPTSRAIYTASRDVSCVRAPVELLSRMSEVARAQGRSESDVWVEAAREWLRRREIEPVTPPAPPATASSRSATPRRPSRVWDDIDALLIELRMAPTHAESEGAPAA